MQITDPAQISVGLTIFKVYKLEGGSWISEHIAKTTPFKMEAFPGDDGYWYFKQKDGPNCSLLDYNLLASTESCRDNGIGDKLHNNHRSFTTREEAEAYLAS